MTTTVLDLGTLYSSPYSMRGLRQTLEPIQAAGQMRRTVNGQLVNVAHSQFKKYRSNISCTDQLPPGFDGFWQGDVITVKCMIELSYKTGVGSPGRTVVTGSSRTDGDFTFYRPELSMMIVNYSFSRDEYGAIVGWSLDLEEV